MQSSANAAATQRRVILIRHAKAVEEDIAGDHARGLSPRGREDAAALALWLKQQGITPELALCSTATRTRETLALVGRNIATILSERIYLSSAAEMLGQIQATDDAVRTLMLVCHNPGAHALLGQLVGTYASEDDADRMMLKFPTGACAVLTFDAAGWNEIGAGKARLEKLRY